MPAMLNNLVGLKPTLGRLPATGVVPACRTLDTISVFALTTGDAAEVLAVAQGEDGLDPYARTLPPHGWNFGRAAAFRFGVPRAEDLEFHGSTQGPVQFTAAVRRLEALGGTAVEIDLRQPMADVRAELSRYPVKTRLSLTGPLVVARDIAHAKIASRLDAGEPLPSYLRDFAVYYAGPAKTPSGYASGSFGPTTAGRMDSYVERFQAAGGSLVMLAKGNRSRQVTDACQKYGGFYLGSIGGPAARLAQDCIRKVEVLEYPELGMEAIWRIEVENFPAFIVIDDKGNDFFKELNLG